MLETTARGGGIVSCGVLLMCKWDCECLSSKEKEEKVGVVESDGKYASIADKSNRNIGSTNLRNYKVVISNNSKKTLKASVSVGMGSRIVSGDGRIVGGELVAEVGPGQQILFISSDKPLNNPIIKVDGLMRGYAKIKKSFLPDKLLPATTGIRSKLGIINAVRPTGLIQPMIPTFRASQQTPSFNQGV